MHASCVEMLSFNFSVHATYNPCKLFISYGHHALLTLSLVSQLSPPVVLEMSSNPLDIYDDGDYKKDVPKSKQTNCLLVRRSVGKVKPTTYALPPPSFCYGKLERTDESGSMVWTQPEAPTKRSGIHAKGPVPYNDKTIFGKPSGTSIPISGYAASLPTINLKTLISCLHDVVPASLCPSLFMPCTSGHACVYAC